jgi:DNA-binding transcriptional LysR family regulator
LRRPFSEFIICYSEQLAGNIQVKTYQELFMPRQHKKFERLILFSEVATHLSFTAAAEQLGISRGYLSEQIRTLENDLDRLLLIRTTRNVKLTDLGIQVLKGMGQIKSSLLELEREISHDSSIIAGRIKITAPSQFTQCFLLDLCADFQRLHPAVQISIDCSYTTYDLTQKDFDIAFRATLNPPQNMIAKPLFTYRHNCCAAPEYLSRHGYPTSIEQLVEHQCLTATEQSLWSFVRKNITVGGDISINDNQMLKQQALLGRGIILVPEYLVKGELASGQLQVVLPEESLPALSIYLVHPQQINQSARLNTFIQFTLDRFKQRQRADHQDSRLNVL